MLFGWIMLLLAWALWAWCCARMQRLHTRPGDPSAFSAMTIAAIRAYARLVHDVRAEVRGELPAAGPLIVVCNHTAGVDPLVVQASLPFEVRWMMGKDMRISAMESFWTFARIIDVDRTGRDTASARKAIAHVKQGGVLGVFPEGRIARPRGTRLPFMPGVGLIVHATGAPVLPVIIRGTPDASTAWGSLTQRSRTRLTIGPVIHPTGKAHDVVKQLEEAIRK